MQAFLARFSHFLKSAFVGTVALFRLSKRNQTKKAKYGKVEVIDQGVFLQWKIVFCKINNREIPSYKVYEDEQVYAF